MGLHHFPQTLLQAVAESLLRVICHRTTAVDDNAIEGKESKSERRKVEEMPYLHKVSHGSKKVAGRYGVDLVFSVPWKLLRLYIMSNASKVNDGKCDVKHRCAYVRLIY